VLCLIYSRSFDVVVAMYDSDWYIKRLNSIENSYSMFCFNLGTIDHPRDHPRVSRVEQELITIPVHLQFLVEVVLLYL
jgi:hypothetical protein